jgi:hypothetical protein
MCGDDRVNTRYARRNVDRMWGFVQEDQELSGSCALYDLHISI